MEIPDKNDLERAFVFAAWLLLYPALWISWLALVAFLISLIKPFRKTGINMIKFKSVLSVILLIIVFSICNITYATETTIADTKKESHCFHLFSASWTPIQLSCVPVSLFDDRSDIYGINIALWLGTFPNNVYGFSYASIANFAWKKHCGISISGIWMVMGDNYGVSIAPANMIHRNNGLMLGLINIGPMGDTMGNGIQIGLVNQATGGLQIGLINYNSNALIPWMPLFNFSFDNKSKE